MEELALVTFFCGGPLLMLAAVAAGLVAASANRQRRDEIRALRADLDQLRVHHTRLAQQLTAPQAAARQAPPEQAVVEPPMARLPQHTSAAPWSAGMVRAEDSPQPRDQDTQTPAFAGPPREPNTTRAAPESAPPPQAPSTPSIAQPPLEPPTRTPLPTQPAPPARKGPGLEEWLGVRGIALLGALTLVIAGIYFFRYSVEHGLITPAMRVIVGVLTGLVCIGVSEKPLRSRHVLLANFIAGAGVAILYLASWSSGALYELVPRPAAFALMAVTTAVCCALAVRHRALSIALIGLLGGFVTPISLSTGQDRPLALFGYLLLLDVALLVVAQRTRWGILALLSVLATFIYQLGWILGRMGSERVWLGVGIVALFALLFAGATALAARRGSLSNPQASTLEALTARLTQGLALLLPFLFPLFFVANTDLQLDLLPTLVLLVALSVGAGVIALSMRAYWIQLAAALAASFTLLVHVLVSGPAPLGWLFMGLTGGLGLVHWGIVEVSVRMRGRAAARALGDDTGAHAQQATGAPSLPSYAFALFASVALFALALGAERTLPTGGALVGLVLVVAAARVATIGGSAWVAALIAPLATVTVAVLHVTQGDRAGRPSEWVWLALTLTPVVAAQGGVLVRTDKARRLLDHGAGLAAFVFAAHLIVLSDRVPVTVALYAGAACLSLALVWLPLARSGVGAYFGPVVLMLALRAVDIDSRSVIENAAVPWLVALVALATAATWLPMLTLGSRARGSRGLYRGSALAMPLYFPALLDAYRDVFGHKSDGVPAVVAGAVVLTSLAFARRSAPVSVRVSATAWPAAAALGFVTVAVPLQLENEWVTVGWALLGAALLALFRRLDHAGLKYFAFLHFVAVGVRLLLNPYLLDYHVVSEWPFVNWLAYTYLVPTVAALVGFMWLKDIEIARRRPLEARLMPRHVALMANALGVLAVALGFVWINLTIIDAFAPHGPLKLDFDRRPARDLTLSLAWALYGAVLLGIGMWRKSTSLRGLSLGLVMLTIGKVFLIDLGNLQDLYRVASLVGLALSLIVISLAYRRFVFPSSDASDQEGGPS